MKTEIENINAHIIAVQKALKNLIDYTVASASTALKSSQYMNSPLRDYISKNLHAVENLVRISAFIDYTRTDIEKAILKNDRHFDPTDEIIEACCAVNTISTFGGHWAALKILENLDKIYVEPRIVVVVEGELFYHPGGEFLRCNKNLRNILQECSNKLLLTVVHIEPREKDTYFDALETKTTKMKETNERNKQTRTSYNL